MSLGSSDMAGSVLGTAFSLLLLASIIQGLTDVQVSHKEKMEAVVGQNVTLPCIVNKSTSIHIVSIEWSMNRNGNTKLVLYSTTHGVHQFWPNVTVQIEEKMSSYLQLSGVTKWQSGIYICEITTFPLGSIRRKTELQIKDADVEIMCDVNNTVEVHAGEKVTIQCREIPNAQYRWTKNMKLVSENESLELPRVTDAHTGVYTLTVNTGNISLHKEFIITVLTASTSLRTDPMTVSPQFNVTEESLIESADSSPTTPLTTGLSTTNTSVTWSVGTDVTYDNPNLSNVTITARISVTSSPATHTDPYHFNKSKDQEIIPTHTLNTSTSADQSVASNRSTTLSYGGTVLGSTQVTGNESMLHTLHPEVSSSSGPEESSNMGSLTENNTIEDEDTDGVRSHLLLVLIIVPVLVLIAVAGFLYRKRIIKERMDLPPSFKPPPPPIKYTAASYSEISMQSFPTSRCNSVTELKYMNQKCINM